MPSSVVRSQRYPDGKKELGPWSRRRLIANSLGLLLPGVAAGIIVPRKSQGGVIGMSGGRYVPPEPSASLPAWYTTLGIDAGANGTWYQLPASSSFSNATGGSAAILQAWCGSTINPNNSEIGLIGGGGHTDSSSNACFFFALEDDAPTWQRPRAATASVSNADFYGDGRPSSAHTYFEEMYVPQIDRYVRFGNGARYSDGRDNYYIVRFDRTAGDWDSFSQSGTALQLATHVGSDQQAWAVAIDNTNGNCYYHVLHNASYTLMRWNAGSPGSVTSLGTTGFNYGYYSSMAFDTIRRRVLSCRGAGNFVYTVGGSLVDQTITNGGPDDQDGLIYVPTNDMFYTRDGGAGGTVRQINPATFASSSYATTGGGSIPSALFGGAFGCFSRFGYAPRLGIAYYIPSYTGRIWALRLHDPLI